MGWLGEWFFFLCWRFWKADLWQQWVTEERKLAVCIYWRKEFLSLFSSVFVPVSSSRQKTIESFEYLFPNERVGIVIDIGVVKYSKVKSPGLCQRCADVAYLVLLYKGAYIESVVKKMRCCRSSIYTPHQMVECLRNKSPRQN